jgi:hypothetical protein
MANCEHISISSEGSNASLPISSCNLTSDDLSTSTCPLLLGPSDYDATRAVDGVVPAYEVLCDYFLPDLVFEDDIPKGFDECAAICLADANCTAFGLRGDGPPCCLGDYSCSESDMPWCQLAYDADPIFISALTL